MTCILNRAEYVYMSWLPNKIGHRGTIIPPLVLLSKLEHVEE